MSGQWKKMGMVAALLGGLAGGSADAAKATPALVYLGDMAWVGGQGVLPQMASGQVFAPVLAACDLLSLDCKVSTKLSATVRYGPRKGQTQTFNISFMNPAAPTVIFAPLARFAGYEVVWDAQNKLMRVQGNLRGANWDWRGYIDNPPAGFTPYIGPLSANQGARQSGHPDVPLTVNAPVGLDQFVVFSRPKLGQGLQMSGSLFMGSVDVPNNFSGCGGKLSCTLPVPRDALWTLALVTTK